MPDGLQYQTIQVSNQSPQAAGPSVRGTAVGAGVKLLHKASVALNGWSVSHRVNRELRRRRGEIEAAIARYEDRIRQSNPNTGVLVVVLLQEWVQPDATGTRARDFLGMHLGGAGTSYQEVLRQYRSQDQLTQGPARGWRTRTVFI